MTISILDHRSKHLGDTLYRIPSNQMRISVNKWHMFLGYLQSMVLVILSVWGLFSQMQKVLCNMGIGSITFSEGFYKSLRDFCWPHFTLASRPTQLYDISPLPPTITRTTMRLYIWKGGTWYQVQWHPYVTPNPNLTLITPTPKGGTVHQVFWQSHLTPYITVNLVSVYNARVP